jgi:hypothetical protein
MLELGEDQGCPGYLGGPAGVGGDVPEGGPALGEQGESAFSPAAQVAFCPDCRRGAAARTMITEF